MYGHGVTVYPLTFDAGSRLSAGLVRPSNRNGALAWDYATDPSAFAGFPANAAHDNVDPGFFAIRFKRTAGGSLDTILELTGGTNALTLTFESDDSIRLLMTRSTSNFDLRAQLANFGQYELGRWLWCVITYDLGGASTDQTIRIARDGRRPEGPSSYQTRAVGSGTHDNSGGSLRFADDRMQLSHIAYVEGSAGLASADRFVLSAGRVSRLETLGRVVGYWHSPLRANRFNDWGPNRIHSNVASGTGSPHIVPSSLPRTGLERVAVPDVRQPVRAGGRKHGDQGRSTGVRTASGGTDCVRLDHEDQLMLVGSGLTLAAWIKWDGSSPGFMGLMEQQEQGGTPNDSTFLMIQDNGTSVIGRLRTQIDLTTTVAEAQGDNFVIANEWMWVGMTWDGDTGGSGPRLWRAIRSTGWSIEEMPSYGIQNAGAGGQEGYTDRPVLLNARSSNAATPLGSVPLPGDGVWHAIVHRELAPVELRTLALQPWVYAHEAPVLWANGRNYGRVKSRTTYVSNAEAVTTAVPIAHRDWHWSAAPLGVEVDDSQCAVPVAVDSKVGTWRDELTNTSDAELVNSVDTPTQVSDWAESPA